jgi:8-oxo-dGTP pyrophosphatase MutT (NUDIX family)
MTNDIEPKRALFALSAAVFAERDGKILLLKRAMGEATGGWYIPGGAVDPGETVEQAAVRELHEEAGLRPRGKLSLVSVAHMHVYGSQSLQVAYAADCSDGDVVISHEHSAFRWIDATDYRARYFSDEALAAYEAADPTAAALARAVRGCVDDYIAWRANRR